MIKILCIIVFLAISSLSYEQKSDPPRAERLDSAKVTATGGGMFHGNRYRIAPANLKKTVTALGEPDVIRYIASLPGVSQGVEGTMALFVRGAGNGSNRIEYDGVPIGNTSHFFGLLSSISSEMTAEATFRPGGISAAYGNLSSSIVDIRRHNALEIDRKCKISISPFVQSIYFALPDTSRRYGIQISARTSPLPLIGKTYLNHHKTEYNSGMDGYVYDFNASIDVRPSENSRADMMFYSSRDDFTYSEDSFSNNTSWSTNAAKIGFGYSFSHNFDLYTKIHFLNNESFQRQGYNQMYSTIPGLKLKGGTKQFMANVGIKSRIGDGFTISGGMEYSQTGYAAAGKKYFDNLFSAYVEAGYIIPEKLELSLGFRGSKRLDLRFLADYYFSDKTGVELAADQLTQYHHVVEGLPTGWTLDIAVPADRQFPEEITRQLYAGVFYRSSSEKSRFNASLGGYVRHMSGLVSFMSGVNLFRMSQLSLSEETDKGTGRSAGIEVAVAWKSRIVEMSGSYTLSRTMRKFDHINNGREFPYKFDRRHILNSHCGLNFGSHLIGLNLSFASGHRETLPVSLYRGVTPPLWGTNRVDEYTVEFNQNLRYRQEMSPVNSFKLRDYLRTDIAYSFVYIRPKSAHTLTVSVFNVFNRHNPYLIFVKDGIWKQLSILPAMPSLRWTVEF